MEADALKELMEALAGDSDYRITLAYDPRARCKQIRFRSTDPDNPYFADIFPLYLSTLTAAENKSAYEDARQALIADYDAVVNESGIDPYSIDWFGPESEIGRVLSDLVERHISRFIGQLGQGRLATASDSELSLVRGIEHIDMIGNTNIQPSYAYNEIFPLQSKTFEGQVYPAPNCVETMLINEYGDYLKLPYDILHHYRHLD
jgi:lipopolysaccharide cholinephosphotransferase